MRRSIRNMGNAPQQPPKNANQAVVDEYNSLAEQYSKKSPDELMGELINARRSGAISDSDMQSFISTVSPMLSPEQREKLFKIFDTIR